MRSREVTLPVARGRALILIGLSILAQTTVLSQPILGLPVRLDLPLMIVVAVALGAPSGEAALIGFATGLAVDLFHTGPFGQHAFSYTATAFLIAVVCGRTGQPVRSVARSAVGPPAALASWLLLVATDAIIRGTGVLAAMADPPWSFIIGAAVGIQLGAVLASMLRPAAARSGRRRWASAPGIAGPPGFSAP